MGGDRRAVGTRRRVALVRTARAVPRPSRVVAGLWAVRSTGSPSACNARTLCGEARVNDDESVEVGWFNLHVGRPFKALRRPELSPGKRYRLFQNSDSTRAA